MAEDQGATETLANGEDNLPQVAMIAQYVKDLSFENPNAPLIYQAPEQPKIDVQFNIGCSGAGTAEDRRSVQHRLDSGRRRRP